MTETKEERKQARGRGKYGERRLAKLVKGEVVGRSKAVKLPSGKFVQVNCQQPPDVVNEWASFEVKYVKSLPKSLTKGMSQAIRNAPEGHIPHLSLASREGDKLIVMREADFIERNIGENG